MDVDALKIIAQALMPDPEFDDRVAQVQGFSYPACTMVRDFALPKEKEMVWKGPPDAREEMLRQLELYRNRLRAQRIGITLQVQGFVVRRVTENTRHTAKTLEALGIAPHCVNVYLDGCRQDRFIVFDEDEGYITRYALDETWRPIIENDCFVEERVTGKVEAWLVWNFPPDGPPRWNHATPKPPEGQRIRLSSVLR